MNLALRMGRWAPLISEASRRFGVAENWIKAVMRMESGGRTELDGKPITSSAGAMGVMQVMPETYRAMRAQYNLGANPYDPRDNVLAGTAYLRWLYEKYGYPKMFAAYNAGPGTLEANLAGFRALPDETRAYIGGIARILGGKADEFQSIKRVATLTRPDGSPVTIEAATVDTIRAAIPNEFAPGVQTVIVMGNKLQGVREDVADVTARLKGPPGKVLAQKSSSTIRQIAGGAQGGNAPKG